MIRKIKFAMFLEGKEEEEEEIEESRWGLDTVDHIPLAHGTDPEDKDWCNYKRCKKPSDIIVKGYGYCDAHFEKKFCQEQEPEDVNGVSYSKFNL